ncbi:hypothetical protein JNW90_14930 [Micromonospora sp. STR1s_5]|nr:hypothetical protein [Micromonospora sp. STR1s_5]
MRLISAAQYTTEMRRLERIRNEAIRRHDRCAELEIKLKIREVNHIFWGRDLPRAA